MLNPKKDFVDYGEILMPPPGFVIQRAIGTTYSLDLRAMLAIPVAMIYSKPLSTEENGNTERLDVFDSISAAEKIVTVFCQRGQIKVPEKYNKLYCFTEDCIHEITPEGPFSSFHPKFWCLWFQNEKTKEKIVRISVLSRNITFDKSWDVAFAFEGLVTREKQSKNNPFLDFVRYLEKKSGVTIEAVYKSSLEKAEFKSNLNIKSWNFYPSGFDHYQNPLSNKSFESILMMSPFIDDDSINLLASKANRKKWLFSRRTELDNIKTETLNSLDKIFCIPENLVNGERNEKMDKIDTDIEYDLDLHAKLYIGLKNSTFHWFLGSSNLSKAALERNIECLIELISDNYDFSHSRVFNDTVSDDKTRKLFEEYPICHTPREATNVNLNQKLRILQYSIANCILTGEIILDETGNHFFYMMTLDATSVVLYKDFQIFIRSINSPLSDGFGFLILAGEINNFSFKELLTESQLSKYFVITITYLGNCEKSFLIKSEININESRKKKIITEIIDSGEKFLKYLKFILSESGIVDEEQELQRLSRFSERTDNHIPIWEKYNFPLFEELLKAASRQPEKLKRIDKIIERLKTMKETESFITPELLNLWEVFKAYIN